MASKMNLDEGGKFMLRSYEDTRWCVRVDEKDITQIPTDVYITRGDRKDVHAYLESAMWRPSYMDYSLIYKEY